VTIPASVTQEEWDVFLAETLDQLAALEEATLRLEQEEADPELVREMFRLAHTIKGSSAAVGLESMTILTHKIEGVLGQLRDGQIAVSPALIDALLQGCDMLHRLVLLPTQPDGAQEPPIHPLLERLDAVPAAGQPPTAGTAEAPSALRPVAAVGLSTAGPAVDGQTSAPAGPTVRIDVQKLDTLMELVGELVIDRERVEQITARWRPASVR
jgi:two-component system, chemotaxis family, sensor kinase CheA